MASQSQGIQQLLTAEKRAAEKVADARKRKTKRIKQARQEAQAEIDKYKNERDKTFTEFENKLLGNRETIAARIDEDTEVKKAQIAIDVKNNKDRVISELIDLVCNMKVEIHRNYFVMYPRSTDTKNPKSTGTKK